MYTAYARAKQPLVASEDPQEQQLPGHDQLVPREWPHHGPDRPARPTAVSQQLSSNLIWPFKFDTQNLISC